jgi:hypothetical protein
LQAAVLESLAGIAGAQVISPELFFQKFVAVDDAYSLLNMRFGREALPAFAHRLEKNGWSSKLRVDMVHLL